MGRLIRFQLGRGAWIYFRVILAVCFFAHSAEAKSHKAKLHSTKSSKSKSVAKHPPDRTDVMLKPENYPPEISGRIAAYNEKLNENKALSHKDVKLAKAKGEVLKIERESFEAYTSFISSADPRQAAKIRKAVALNGWYKGIPQIAFIASMGLPDDLEAASDHNQKQLRLIYKSDSYYFEKGTLRSWKK
jgi:hypothetical protein